MRFRNGVIFKSAGKIVSKVVELAYSSLGQAGRFAECFSAGVMWDCKRQHHPPSQVEKRKMI